MPPTITDLENIAHRAGKIIYDGYNKQHSIDAKGMFDVVTEIDHQSEAITIEMIHNKFPDDRIITEESGILGSDVSRTWYLDPLDGTINYAHNLPYFGFSLAYEENGILQLSVVYDPLREELFSAEHGRGAWLNGEFIRVNDQFELSKCLVVNEFSHNRDIWDRNMKGIQYFVQHTQGIRHPGSCVLDLCYVACGRYDGFWVYSSNSWDLAAGALIVMEAGGTITNVQGDDGFLYNECSIIAANHELHDRMLTVLK